MSTGHSIYLGFIASNAKVIRHHAAEVYDNIYRITECIRRMDDRPVFETEAESDLQEAEQALRIALEQLREARVKFRTIPKEKSACQPCPNPKPVTSNSPLPEPILQPATV